LRKKNRPGGERPPSPKFEVYSLPAVVRCPPVAGFPLPPFKSMRRREVGRRDKKPPAVKFNTACAAVLTFFPPPPSPRPAFDLRPGKPHRPAPPLPDQGARGKPLGPAC